MVNKLLIGNYLVENCRLHEKRATRCEFDLKHGAKKKGWPEVAFCCALDSRNLGLSSTEG